MPLGYLLPVTRTHLGHSGRGGVVALFVFWRFLSVDVLESLFCRRASAFPTGHIQKPELVSDNHRFFIEARSLWLWHCLCEGDEGWLRSRAVYTQTAKPSIFHEVVEE